MPYYMRLIYRQLQSRRWNYGFKKWITNPLNFSAFPSPELLTRGSYFFVFFASKSTACFDTFYFSLVPLLTRNIFRSVIKLIPSFTFKLITQERYFRITGDNGHLWSVTTELKILYVVFTIQWIFFLHSALVFEDQVKKSKRYLFTKLFEYFYI